jgi:hypothetical protein
MYDIKKQNGFFCVIAKSTGMIQYKSTRRIFCVDWISENELKAE